MQTDSYAGFAIISVMAQIGKRKTKPGSASSKKEILAIIKQIRYSLDEIKAGL